eukprot:TRINITY_DN2469_c0_g1_i1.p1 TRINITY_DN2469_c0_g1~~TRINITY_DN2469_c0_g1_i1.p1  ORF type:complete len:224 (-),score=52.88 TRINITY_DN2469_c0_g1_i1:121-717(-)
MRPRFSYDYLVKLIIIGDSGVGKTCLLTRFAENKFTASHISTIGIDFLIKMLRVDDVTIKLQIWDTAGQDRFRTITQNYYKNAVGVILVYDCTSETSFNNIRSWMKQLESHANHDVIKVLVGNKYDSPDIKVDAARGKALAEEFGIEFFEASAKDNVNVGETFEYLVKEIKNKTKPVEKPEVRLEVKEKKQAAIAVCC